MNLKNRILELNDIKYRDLEIPEWDCSVKIKTWSVAERLKIQSFASSPNATSAIVVFSLVGEDNSLIFTEEDIESLQNKNGIVVEKIAVDCLEWNGVGKEGEAKK